MRAVSKHLFIPRNSTKIDTEQNVLQRILERYTIDGELDLFRLDLIRYVLFRRVWHTSCGPVVVINRKMFLLGFTVE